MAEEKEGQASASEAWDEVGRQFRSLGESLASAFKSSWEGEETRQHLERMQEELESMAAEVVRSARQAVESKEGQKIKAEVKKAAQSAQTAGQQTAKELQPQLLDAFLRVRSELDQFINRMEVEQEENDDRTE